MSFSADVKSEISIIEPKKECCAITLNNCFDTSALQDCIMGKCCIKVLLREAFLLYGSVNNPEKSYHLEIVLNDEELASLLYAFMDDYDMGAKIMLRSGTFVVYIKGAESISDFLKLLGAGSMLMKFENVRILKEMRSNINRSVNCESSNIQKKIDASFRQIECIEYIKEKAGLDYLSEDLKELAETRLENREMGLAELGEKLNRKIGKSGVSHRMKKIIDIAENLKNKGDL